MIKPVTRHRVGHHIAWLALLATAPMTSSVRAAEPCDAAGLWLSAQKDAVLEFKPCDDRSGALCGRIVWDKDAGTPI